MLSMAIPTIPGMEFTNWESNDNQDAEGKNKKVMGKVTQLLSDFRISVCLMKQEKKMASLRLIRGGKKPE